MGTFIGIVDKVMLILCIFYLKIYGPNWIIIMIPAISCLALSGLLSFFLLDSPQFHYDKGNLKRARHLFLEISKWNGIKHDENSDFQFFEKNE